MGKFKPARGKRKTSSRMNAVPCFVLLLSGMLLLSLLFYYVLKQG